MTTTILRPASEYCDVEKYEYSFAIQSGLVFQRVPRSMYRPDSQGTLVIQRISDVLASPQAPFLSADAHARLQALLKSGHHVPLECIEIADVGDVRGKSISMREHMLAGAIR